MAAPTVSLIGAVQDSAESGTWSSGSLDADSEIQGNNCIGTKVSNATTTSTVTGTSRNFGTGGAQEDHHVIIWLNCTTPTLNNKAAGGFRVNIGASNWYVGGQDDRKPGWGAYIVDPTSTPTNGASITTATVYGGTISTASNIMGNFNNGLWDQITIIRGIQVSDGDVPNPAGFLDAWTADFGTKANRWGGIREDNGIWFSQVPIFFNNAYVRQSGQVVVFEDNEFVSDTFYELAFENGSNVVMGETGGNIYRSASATKRFTWNDSVGVTENNGLIDGAAAINSNAAAIWNSTNVKDSGVFNQNGSQVNGVVISGGTADGIVIDDLSKIDGLGVTDCTGNGIDLTNLTGTSFTLTNIVSSGNVADVVVNNAADVTLNVSASSSIGTAVNSGAGNVTIVTAQTTVTFDGIPDGLEIRLRAGSVTLPNGYQASVTGNKFDYTYSAGQYAGKLIKASIGGVANDGNSYERQEIPILLPSTAATYPLTFNINPSYV